MNFLEKDLEQIIFEADGLELIERGFVYVPKLRKRQLKIGNYGIADLVTIERVNHPYYKCLEITIYEFKKDIIDDNTFIQSIRYARGIQRYLDKRNIHLYTIHIVLCGRRISGNSNLIYLADMFDGEPKLQCISSISMYTYDYKLNGLGFDLNHSYSLVNEGF